MQNWEKIKKDPKLTSVQKKRAEINDYIRSFFKVRGFLEAQTPILVECAGQEPYLNPFQTEFYDEKGKSYLGYLITSPEYSLKKMLCAGFDKVFELARVFRSDESFGPNHNPEFTMLEWYRSHSNYYQIMLDLEQLVFEVNKKINKSKYLVYENNKIDLSLPWPKMTVKQAFKKYAHLDLDQCKNLKNFKKLAIQKDFTIDIQDNWDDVFYKVFLNAIEPRLPKDRPMIIYEYPLHQASLAKRKNKKSFYAERFEAYIGGMELANAFSELTDYKEQYKRFKEEQDVREKLNKKIIPIDNDFINALKSKMPDSGGIALGVDRLQMLILNINDINDLLMFPAKQIFK
ncbi:MAG: EF-P lysine aminoacylase EpmA [Candidatus Parcubacteria bacterium]|nr:EF-P lysine aminoacylase EpmA [Candidatus Parcubacteria bacterium]